ncbi:MAG: glycoside hydrolase family 27 protein, partial [Crocinitomicaceae bacterium]|nr:glycoside hydrolase family 27 protein [Crocinitomicaceae bacterium]
MKQLLTLSIVVFLTIQSSWGQVALTPPMGWNTWNYFGKNDINEQIVRECIDAIIENHLKDYGYSYVIVDGGWRTSKLDTNGKLIPDSTKFPNGIKSLVDYAHSKGLKFGLHTVPGTHDCGGDKVGGYGLEEIHIQQFIDWGLDFIKVDRCRLELPGCEECWTEDTIEKVYRKWRSILDNKGSNMILSISAYKFRPWNPDVSNLSRTTSDLSARVSQGAFFSSEERGKQPRYALSVLDVADINNESAQFAKPGYWNDPDILVTGDNGLSFIEQRSHFALWCIMSAPLILGNDVRKISDKEKEIILNKEAISINREPT